MLRAATRPKKRDFPFPRALNPEQSAFQALVRTAGAAEQSVKIAKRMRLIGRKPYCLHRVHLKSLGGVLEAFVRGNVRGIVRVVISNDAKFDFGRHGLRIGPE